MTLNPKLSATLLLRKPQTFNYGLLEHQLDNTLTSLVYLLSIKYLDDVLHTYFKLTIV